MKCILLVFLITQKQRTTIAEIRKENQAKRRKKAGRSVSKPELVERINDIVKDSGSFDCPAPSALAGSLVIGWP